LPSSAPLDDALIYAAGVGDEHQQQSRRRQGHHLEMADRRRGQGRVLHDGDLTGQLGEQANTAPQHVVQVDAGVEELQDRPSLRRGQRLDVGDAVDELPVALVCGDTTRAGVRLRDVALGLQHGHVVAHGSAGHSQIVSIDQCFRSDGLLRRDIVGDQGTQDLETSILRTRHRNPPTLGTGGCAGPADSSRRRAGAPFRSPESLL
jgi:hypothetical protein